MRCRAWTASRNTWARADQVVELTGDAEILVTQLAPLSASIMDRLPTLKFVAVSRGGPVNIDMKAARARGITVVNTPGRNASAVAEFTIGAILARRARSPRAMTRCAAANGGATSTAPTSPARNSPR